MTREKLLTKYKKYGSQKQVDFFVKKFKEIDETTKEEAIKEIMWWCEYEERCQNNLSLSESQLEYHNIRETMFNDLLYLDEFKGVKSE